MAQLRRVIGWTFSYNTRSYLRTDSRHASITVQTRTSRACRSTNSRTQLLGLRHTGQISNARQGILDEIAPNGLLRYRGCRGGRRQRRYRQLRLNTNSACGHRIDQAGVRILTTDVHSRSRPVTGTTRSRERIPATIQR